MRVYDRMQIYDNIHDNSSNNNSNSTNNSSSNNDSTSNNDRTRIIKCGSMLRRGGSSAACYVYYSMISTNSYQRLLLLSITIIRQISPKIVCEPYACVSTRK